MQGLTNRTRLSAAWPVQRDHGGCLRLTISFVDRNLESLLKGFENRHWQRFTTRNWKSNRRNIVVAVRSAQNAIHGRNCEKYADLVFLDQTEDLRRLKTVHENH